MENLRTEEKHKQVAVLSGSCLLYVYFRYTLWRTLTVLLSRPLRHPSPTIERFDESSSVYGSHASAPHLTAFVRKVGKKLSNIIEQVLFIGILFTSFGSFKWMLNTFIAQFCPSSFSAASFIFYWWNFRDENTFVLQQMPMQIEQRFWSKTALHSSPELRSLKIVRASHRARSRLPARIVRRRRSAGVH